MKKTICLFFPFFIIAAIARGQQNCNCKDYIKDVAALIDKNYADRASVQKKDYQNTLKKISLQSKNTSYDDCILLIYTLLSKLKDNHISFFIERDSGSVFLRALYDSSAMNKLFAGYSQKSKQGNSIEGLWENDNKDVEYIILKEKPGTYNVLIWNSKIPAYKRGQLKGVLTKLSEKEYVYKSYGSTKIATAYKMIMQGEFLYSFVTGNWRRRLPDGQFNKFNPVASMTSLSGNALLLTLPSFSLQNKSIIDSLIKVSQLSRTDHLIIDIRTNLGGSIQAYQSILPFLYTNPIRIESGIYYSSPGNIENLKQTLLKLNDTSTYYYSYKKLIDRLEKAPGKLLVDTGYYYRQDSIYDYPKRVSIIVGKRCASAGELFLITALQSKKVTLFGENSAGICDRLDAYSFTGSCKGLRMNIPISVRMQESYLKPIDNVGIPPKIKIPPKENWINYVLSFDPNNEK